MAIYVLSNTAIPTTLDEDLTDSELDITVVDGSTYPAADFITRVNLELIDVQSRSGNVLTVRSGGRGYNGTTAVAHSTSDIIEHVLDTADLPFRRTVGSVNWEAQGAIDLSNQRLYAPLDPTTGLDVGDRAYNDLRYAGIATIITDHDELAGLGDDDHSIYWNDTRGDAKILTHKNLVSAHHVKYTDGEAVSAVGTPWVALIAAEDHDHATPIGVHAALVSAHHVKYTDAEAAAKIAADDLYVKIAGDTMGGLLNMAGFDINMNAGDLYSPADPSTGLGVGDRDYNDARYLEILGSTATGVIDRSGVAALTTKQFRNIYISDSAPGSPTEGDVWLDTTAAAGGGGDLADLDDVTITSIASGEMLQWNGSAWINQTFAELDIATLTYVDGLDLTDLNNVNITSVAGGEILKWGGSNWINNTLAEANIFALDGSLAMQGDIDLDGYDLTFVGDIDFTSGGYIGNASTGIRINFDSGAGDIAFYDSSNVKILEFDDSDNRWESTVEILTTSNFTTDGGNINMLFPDTTKYIAGSGFAWDTSTTENLNLKISTDGGSVWVNRASWHDEGHFLLQDSAGDDNFRVDDDGEITVYGLIAGLSAGSLNIYGGVGALGARIELFSSNAASNSNDMYLNADTINFRTAAGTLYGRFDSTGDFHIGGDQMYFDTIGGNDYIQLPEASNYFRVVLDGGEEWRVNTSGDTYQTGDYMFFNGTASNDSIQHNGTNVITRTNNVIMTQVSSGGTIQQRGSSFYFNYGISNNDYMTHDGNNIYTYVNGTNTFLLGGDLTPGARDGTVALGTAAARFQQIFSNLSSGGSVATTVRFRTSDDQLFNGASSIRYKEHVRDIEGWERIYDVQARTFRYKVDQITSFGMIAEEMETVFPEVVEINKEGEPEAIAYDWLIAPAIAAIQDHNVRITSVESRLAALEAAA